mgnify:CR=1 FL=1
MQRAPDAVNALPLGGAVLAVDIGGTWTRVCWAGPTGLREVRREPTPGPAGESIVDVVVRLGHEVLASGVPAPALIGVSATGPVDIVSGRLFAPPNAPGLSDVSLGEELAARLGLPVRVDRDTNAALLAESAVGAATDAPNAVYMTISTGVGGAVLLNGRLLRGADGVAGEIGHIVVVPGGPVCGCGRRGCLEAVASGSGLGLAGTELAQRDPGGHLGRRLADCAARGVGTLRGVDVAEAARAGDASALALLSRASAAVVSAVVDLVNVFNPEVVVLGGAITFANPEWAPMAEAAVRAQGLRPASKRAEVRLAHLGGSAELIGAALLAWD